VYFPLKFPNTLFVVPPVCSFLPFKHQLLSSWSQINYSEIIEEEIKGKATARRSFCFDLATSILIYLTLKDLQGSYDHGNEPSGSISFWEIRGLAIARDLGRLLFATYPRFNPRVFYLGFVVNKEALEKIVLRSLRFTPAIIPPMFHIYL
jgi:hypothetical protein